MIQGLVPSPQNLIYPQKYQSKHVSIKELLNVLEKCPYEENTTYRVILFCVR